MRNILLIFCILFSVQAFGQREGVIKPTYLGWPGYPAALDSTIEWIPQWDTALQKTIWRNPTYLGLPIIIGGDGTDSLFITGDSICVIDMGDTLCVGQDSLLFYPDSICLIQMGDTTCYSVTVSGTTPISSLTNALNGNVLSCANYMQQWQWPGLASNSGLFLETYNQGAGVKKLLELNTYGATSGTSNSLYINNISTGSANYGINAYVNGGSSNYAVYGSTSTGSGIFGLSLSGTGTTGYSESGLPLLAHRYTTSTNTSIQCLDIRRGTDGTPAAGLGSYLTFTNMATGPNYAESNRIASNWIDANYATRKSQMIFSGVKAGNSANYITISGDSITMDSNMFHLNVVSNYLGINKYVPVRTLDVVGLMNLKQSSTLSNAVINGGNATMTGDHNQIIGVTAGNALTSGTFNVLLGEEAGRYLTTGANNICIGQRAGAVFSSEDTESLNISIGYFAGFGSGGDTVICIGALAGGGTDMDGSVLIGYNTGDPTVGGAYKRNTMIGHMAGSQYGGGSGNVIIGYKAAAGQSIGNDKLWVDNSSTSTPLIKGDFANDSLRINGILSVKNRFKPSQGTDIGSAAAITLPGDGNTFEVIGTTTIDQISKTGWFNGNEITLIFSSSVTLTDGVANSGSNIGFELAGNSSFGATADDVLKLMLCEIGGVQRWREISRSAN